MEMEKTLEKLRDIIKHEMDTMTLKGEMDEKTLDCYYKMVDILKDIGEIEDYDSGYSQRMYPHDPYMNGTSYGMGMRGNSYRNTMYRGGNSYRSGYSRGGNMMDRLQQMMDEAQTDKERNAIQMAMNAM